VIQETIDKLVSGCSLTRETAADVMRVIMAGEATPAQIGALVTALRMKGETPDEIAGMAQVMRESSLHVDVEGPLVDTAGTGGDASNTFNISTTAAFVIAGAGVRVAKHGNRAMSGSTGSADVLEALGVKIDLSPAGVKACLETIGIGFMFAQIFHPSMRFAAGPRREIGIRTVFNMLGPLTNPAGANAQVIGVADPELGEKMARVLGMLGSAHSLVVHGTDGLDEMTLSGESQVWELKDGNIEAYTVTPTDLGFDKVHSGELRVSSAEESARVLRDVLNGAAGPTRNVVVVNAAAGLLAVDRVRNLKQGVKVASESIDSGMAQAKLDGFIVLSQTLE
jgi:anthranilate phosphoribosyltransferase